MFTFYFQIIEAKEEGCKILVAEKESFHRLRGIDKKRSKNIDLKEINKNFALARWQFDEEGYLVITAPPLFALAPFTWNSTYEQVDFLLDWNGKPKWVSGG